ncbi:MAG: septation protein SepH, partial [Acidimicrobiales bacterium]
MHQLHLVGFTADHDGLIFSTKMGATTGAYVVDADDELFATLEEARRHAMVDPDASAQTAAQRVKDLRATQRSSLSVREIQSRLRGGMSLSAVAREAGVDDEWVARFAAPVLAEQAAVVERAMSFTFTTARKGASSKSLGEAVRWTLRDRGIAADTSSEGAGWSAFQLEPGQWAVRFSYTSRGRQQVAEWEVDLETDELFARNRLASDLGYVEAGARRRPPVEAPAPPPARKPAPAAKKATSGRQGRPARTETARAQAANATSSKAAAARAKSARPSQVGKKVTRAAQGPRGGGASTRGGAPAPQEPQPPQQQQPAPSGLARFPAPRPASARPAGLTPPQPPRRQQARPVLPAEPRSRPASQPEPQPPRPQPLQPAPERVDQAPAAAYRNDEQPSQPPPQRIRSGSGSRPVPQPAVRRVVPPEPQRPVLTADARPMAVA